MKMNKQVIAIPVILFLIALSSDTLAQMSGGMRGPGFGMGQGMMGARQGYGADSQQQPAPNLTPEEQKAHAKAFVEEYIRRYLPEYKLERKDEKKSK